MFSKKKTLGRRYPSAESAYAPLRAVCLGSKRIAGDICIPKTSLIYVIGGGRFAKRYTVKVLAERQDDGFAITASIDRFPNAYVLLYAGLAAYDWTMVVSRHINGGGLYFMISGVLLVGGIFGYSLVNGADVALKDLSTFYDQDPTGNEPTSQP
jgi:hypothetical protein